MSRRLSLPATRRHIHVYDEDWEFIESHYGASAPIGYKVGCAVVCREIIHQRINQIKAKQIEALDNLSDSETLPETELSDA